MVVWSLALVQAGWQAGRRCGGGLWWHWWFHPSSSAYLQDLGSLTPEGDSVAKVLSIDEQAHE